MGYVLPSNYAGSEGMRGRPDPNWPAPAVQERAGPPAAARVSRPAVNPNSLSISAWQLKKAKRRLSRTAWQRFSRQPRREESVG
jgi:hypothetical protein